MLPVKERESVRKFLDSLTKEREMFTLSFEEISESKFCFSEKKNGVIIGLVGILKNNQLFIVVKSEYQSRSLGHRLMAKVINEAMERSYPYIDLMTFRCNKRAIRLYEEFGFKALFNDVKRDGRPICRMTKPLNFKGSVRLVLVQLLESFPHQVFRRFSKYTIRNIE